MRMYLIDTKTGFTGPVEIPEDWKTMASAIHCEYIETALRRLGGKEFIVICDEDGGRKLEKRISAVYDTRSVRRAGTPVAFVGSLLIAGMPDGEGNLTGITDKDVSLIGKRITNVKSWDDKVLYPCVKGIGLPEGIVVSE